MLFYDGFLCAIGAKNQRRLYYIIESVNCERIQPPKKKGENDFVATEKGRLHKWLQEILKKWNVRNQKKTKANESMREFIQIKLKKSKKVLDAAWKVRYNHSCVKVRFQWNVSRAHRRDGSKQIQEENRYEHYSR